MLVRVPFFFSFLRNFSFFRVSILGFSVDVVVVVVDVVVVAVVLVVVVAVAEVGRRAHRRRRRAQRVALRDDDVAGGPTIHNPKTVILQQNKY